MRSLRKIRVLRKRKEKVLKASISTKTKLLIGAGGLLLFIVGLKRSHRLDDQDGVVLDRAAAERIDEDVQPPG